MKKAILFLAIIFALAFTADAQRSRTVHRHKSTHKYTTTTTKPRPKPHTLARFHDDIGELQIHLIGELGVSDPIGIFWHEYPHHYSVGCMSEVQAGRLLSLGMGAEYYGTRNMLGHYENSAFLNTIPIYANIRLSTPGWSTKLFAEARVGYAIPTNQAYIGNPGRVVSAKGFYTGAGVGFNCYGNSISFGFNTIDIRNTEPNQPILHNASGAESMVTDFYIRYSYAIPAN